LQVYPRPGHGRRLDAGRGTGLGELARSPSGQGGRGDAERVGDRLRRRGARGSDRAPTFWLAPDVPHRSPAVAGGAVGLLRGGRTGDLEEFARFSRFLE